MATIPAAEELRRKAEATREAADLFTHPDTRAKMSEIAAEYEQLAKRAEEFDERTRLGARCDDILNNWHRRKLLPPAAHGGSQAMAQTAAN